jgi:hypothetical protein
MVKDMSSHVVIQIDQSTVVFPPLFRQNALTPEQWKKLTLIPKPSEAFLPQKWDIEKGRY